MMTISLNDNWQCVYTAPQTDLPDFIPVLPLTALDEWVVDAQPTHPIAWLRRTFELDTTDHCVNYVLKATSAPADTHVYVNNEIIGRLQGAVDITMLVALGENEIVFKVPSSANGQFAGVELHAVPCD